MSASEIMLLIPLTNVRLHPCDPSAAHVPPNLPAHEFNARRRGRAPSAATVPLFQIDNLMTQSCDL